MLCFVGSIPTVSTGTAGTGHPAPSGVMSFAQVHPYLFLHFRVFLKTSPSTGWTSPDAAPLPSRCVKNPWVTGAVWGCDNLAGATATPLMEGLFLWVLLVWAGCRGCGISSVSGACCLQLRGATGGLCLLPCPCYGCSLPGILATPPSAGPFFPAFPRGENPFPFPVLLQHIADVGDAGVVDET